MKKWLFVFLSALWFSVSPVWGQGAENNSGNITTTSATCATATSCVVLNLPPNTGSVAINASGTWTGTLSFEGASGTVMDSINCSPYPSGAAVTSTTGNDTWLCSVPGLTVFQVRGSAAMTGTAVVRLQSTTAMSKSIFQSSPTFADLTAGSVLFAGTGGLVSQNNAKFFWDNPNERLGVGTAAPTAPITVVENANNANQRVDIQNTNAGTLARAGFIARADTAQGVLDAHSSGNTQSLGASYDSTGVVAANLVRLGAVSSSGLLLDTFSAAPIVFGTNVTERMRILSGGNIGIGTNAPDSSLHVIGGVCIESSDTGCAAPSGKLIAASTIKAVTTSATTISSAATDIKVGGLTIPAAYLNASNHVLDFSFEGIYTTVGGQTPTIISKIKLCTVTGCGSGTVLTLFTSATSAATTASASNSWHLRVTIGTVATGASGTVVEHNLWQVTLGATGVKTITEQNTDINTAATAAIDLTAQLFLEVYWQFSTGTTNTVTTNTSLARAQ